MGRGRLVFAVFAAVLFAGALTAGAGTATPPRPTPVVPSLEPEATEALWKSLVKRPRHVRAQATCQPLRGVFYAATDWLRLATKLAATPSPCAQYYVSIPPIVGDKTNLRPGQAERIRALGQSFHALAEIHWTTWGRWVADNQTTWYAAGVEARRRMAQAGFDLAAGDTWAVNEFPSTVRSNTGTARSNARELVRGLYEGDGTRPTRGVVFIVGLGQPTTNVSVYQTNLQNWLADTAFWTDMSAYVSDWSQEVYGDFRRHAVPGAPITTRRDYLNDYLQHALLLSRAGPVTIEPARTYLPGAFSPVANAAWQFESGYGWTNVPFDQMKGYVSAQVYALRSFSATAGLAQDHWGFAWQPRNASGLSAGEFAAQTGSILDRLGAAVRDSGQTVPNDPDPGSGACGPPGQNIHCVGDLAGAQFGEQWKALRVWLGPVLSFATPPQTLTAGQPSTPIGLGLQTSAGAPLAAAAPIAVTLTSGSPSGEFAPTAAGPWTTTQTLTIAVGATTAPPFFYRDTRAGRPQLRATAAGVTTATQVETVGPGPPSFLRVDPGSARLDAQRSTGFAVTAEDAFGNPTSVRPQWTVSPASLATVAPKTGAKTTLTAGGRGGRGLLRATIPQVTAIATVHVEPGPIRVRSIRYEARRGVVRVTASVAELAGKPARLVRTAVVVRRNGRRVFSATKRTDAAGRTTYIVPRGTGCYTTKVTSLAAPGYRWNGRTPANRFCVRT